MESTAIPHGLVRPASVAGRHYVKALYGEHPYGHEMTEQTLARISTDDMRRFYEDHVGACRARVSLVGAVDRIQADALVRQLLARLPGDLGKGRSEQADLHLRRAAGDGVNAVAHQDLIAAGVEQVGA